MQTIKFISWSVLLILMTAFSLKAQRGYIHGNVYEKEVHGNHFHIHPLVGANVVWLGTTRGTVTDDRGHFHLEISVELPHKLLVSYIGYQSDTVLVNTPDDMIAVVLELPHDLDEVEVTARRPGAHVSSLDPILTQVLTTSELQRAACCNLSEAFETNISVDVSYSDAVSGAQQIQMLGLAGIYSQIMIENIPGLRGLSQPFGLSYIPGPWMESISISKGAASVVNGYESITGQINVDLKKPEGDELFFYNAFAGSDGRLETSLNATFDLNDHWSAMVLAHGELFNNKIDHNHNSFLDHPLIRKYNVMNRYRYDRHGVMDSQFGFNIMQENREGGQKDFFSNNQVFGSDQFFGFGTSTSRFQAFARTGFYLPGKEDASIGTQLQFTHHQHESHYGLRPYDGEQNTFYANLLYTNTIGNPDHRFVTGFSFLFEDYSESLEDSLFTRRESVPGAFFEYTFHTHESFTAILAARADYHNLYGLFVTPRTHLHFNLGEDWTIRASAGKGYRVPNPLAENTGLLVSNRRIIVTGDIEPEEAWNYGGSITRRFRLFGHDASFAGEVYRTSFINQLVVDVDTDPGKVIFYNLDGDSYANNYQLELNMEPYRFLEITAAYRYSDVHLTINDELRSKPFVNRYRGMLSASYATPRNDWQFDVTAQFNGRSRIPDLPDSYDMPATSPSYTILNAQITYRWRNLDVYAGGENLTNFIQKNPILNPHHPFDDGFDGSMIWGPLMGRKFYAGVRYLIERRQPHSSVIHNTVPH
ncbi:MAG: TonB-dependent receptor [Bacteroidales bacterium]|nr:TonB-dependent receptor [Bacteroidales bacterium]